MKTLICFSSKDSEEGIIMVQIFKYIVEFHCTEPDYLDARDIRLSLKKYGVTCRFED